MAKKQKSFAEKASSKGEGKDLVYVKYVKSVKSEKEGFWRFNESMIAMEKGQNIDSALKELDDAANLTDIEMPLTIDQASADVTYEAQYDINSYVITFINVDDSVTTQTVDYGVVTTPPVGVSTDEKVLACTLAQNSGADFVKTSTGFSSAGAIVEDVKIMRETVGDEMGVKASGGIKTAADVKAMVDAGANRIGTSSSISIIHE